MAGLKLFSHADSCPPPNFSLMGAFTVLGGFILGCLLPDSFKRPYSTFLPRRQIFTDREIHILNTRVQMDDPMKGKKKKHIGKAGFKKAVCLFQPRSQNHYH